MITVVEVYFFVYGITRGKPEPSCPTLLQAGQSDYTFIGFLNQFK